MNQEQINSILEAQKVHLQKLYGEFEIGQTIQFYPESGSHYEVDDNGLLEGGIVDKKLGKHGVDLRVDIDGSGTRLWISAEDAF